MAPTTVYTHGSQTRYGDSAAPQVRPSDREIKVGTAWAPLLDPAVNEVGARELPSTRACEYARNGRLLLLENLFSPAECARLIEAAESIGFGRTDYPKTYRGNLRLITTDPMLTEAVWQRLREQLPAVLTVDGETWHAVGLNECWRLAKYFPGDRFEAHCDACYDRSDTERSMFTVNVYMNDVAHGGATRFYSGTREDTETPVLSVQPEAGLAVIFRQPPEEQLLHDGEELAGGTKYLFRSDVMYRQVRPVAAERERALDASD